MTTLHTTEIEKPLGCELPGLYRVLSVNEGYGPVGPDAEIYHPAAVRDLYDSFFADPKQLYNPYFPFGCQNQTQELWIIDASTERATSIGHETVPDDWSEEEWLSHEDWVFRFYEPEYAKINAEDKEGLT